MLAVYLPAALLALGQGILVTTLPLYANSIDSSYGIVSLIVGAAALGTLVTDVPAGALVGRLGLRRTMTIGTTLVALSTLAIAIPQPIEVLMLLRILSGIGTALWGLSRHAFIASAIPVAERGRAISLFGGINRIGVFGGPAIGGVLADVFGFRSSFLVSGLLSAGALVLAIRYIQATNTPIATGTGRDRWAVVGQVIRTNWQDLSAASVAVTLAQTIRAGRLFIIPLYGADVLDLTVAQVGYIMTTSSLLDVSMFIPAGLLMDRFGRKVAAVPSFGIMAIGVALIPLASDFLTLMGATAIVGLGNGLGSGTMMTLGADLAPDGATGEFLGIWRLIGDVGAFTGPVCVGVIAGMTSLKGSAVVLALVGVAAAATLALLVRETRQVAAPAPAEPVPR
jgi:MFS family permease